jgi:hypothetical protein
LPALGSRPTANAALGASLLTPPQAAPEQKPGDEESFNLHIKFDRSVRRAGSHEWVKWLLLLLIAAGTAVAGLLLFSNR